MIQQAHKYVSLSLWPCLTFFELKITYNRNQVGWDWKRVSYRGNEMFHSRRCVFCRTISLPSFNGLRCKRPRSIYQYSNMALRLSGQTSIFGSSLKSKSPKSVKMGMQNCIFIFCSCMIRKQRG